MGDPVPSWHGLVNRIFEDDGSCVYSMPITGKLTRSYTPKEQEDLGHVSRVVDDLLTAHTTSDFDVLGSFLTEIQRTRSNETAARETLSELIKASLAAVLLEPPLLPLSGCLQAKNFAKQVRVRVQISGQSAPKNVSQMYELRSEDELEAKTKAEWVDVSQITNHQDLRRVLFESRTKARPVKDSTRIDYCEVFVRQLPGEGRYREESFRPVLVYFVNCGELPSSRKVELTGIVTEDDKHNLTLFVYRVVPLELGFEAYRISRGDNDSFQRYFSNNPNLRSDLDRTIAPHIVGRDEAKLADALVLHSPLFLLFEGRQIRGGLEGFFVGDSTNGKSEILRWNFEQLRLGERAVGETASRAGISYTIDSDHDMIRWGVLVLADRTICFLDGMQGFPPEELPQLREVLRSWKVVVTRKVSGEAPARVRIIAAANPQKPMSDYTDRAESLLDVRSIEDASVDLTRYDFFVPFSSKDVPRDIIAEAVSSPPVIPVDVLQKHVYFAWRLRPEEVLFESSSMEAIRESFQALLEISTPRLPLIHNGYKEVLARISAAFAVLHHNVGDDGSVRILRDHVLEARAFIEELLQRWEYPELVRRLERMTELSDEEFETIKSQLSGDLTLKRAFEAVVDHPGIQSEVLATKIDRHKREAIDNTNRLKALGLIESQPRKPGYRLSRKGNTFYRRTRSKSDSDEEARVVGQLQLERVKIDDVPLSELILRKEEELEATYEWASRDMLTDPEDSRFSKWPNKRVEAELDRMIRDGVFYEPWSDGRLRRSRASPGKPSLGTGKPNNAEHRLAGQPANSNQAPKSIEDVTSTDPVLEAAQDLTKKKGQAHIDELQKALEGKFSIEEINARMDRYASESDGVRRLDWGLWRAES